MRMARSTYSIGDVVVYGRQGVCRVEAVGAPPVATADASKAYYTLALVHRAGRIYAPTDTRTSMRPVITREAALALMERIPDIDESVYQAPDTCALKQHYDALLSSDDCDDLVHIIKSIWVKRQSLAQTGKLLGQLESQYLRHAEEMLYDELAVALGVPQSQVQSHIEEAVRALTD